MVAGQRFGTITVYDESESEIDLSQTRFYLNHDYLGNANAMGVFLPEKKLKGNVQIIHPACIAQNVNLAEGLKKNATLDIRLKVKEPTGNKKRPYISENGLREMLESCGDSLDTAIIPEITPTLNGDEKGYAKFLSENLIYPQSAIEHGKQGTVYILFMVSEKGVPYCFHLLKGVVGAPELEEEAMRVVQLLPALTPAMSKGIPVKSILTLPVTFKLN